MLYSYLRDICRQLALIYSEPEVQEAHAWWLLQQVSGRSKEDLIRDPSVLLSPTEVALLQNLIEQHVVHHQPIAYLFGTIPFGSLELLIKPPILIPRWETEEWTIALIEKLKLLHHTPLRILDLCTGSGCIALSLAHALPQADVVAVDIEPEAIELARSNAQRNGIKNVVFLRGNLFEPLNRESQLFDLIVTNPPYLAHSEWETLAPTVTKWEDKKALIAGKDGLEIIESIIAQASLWLNPASLVRNYDTPQLIIEIGYAQGKQVAALCKKYGISGTIEKDSAQCDRIVTGKIEYANSSSTTSSGSNYHST